MGFWHVTLPNSGTFLARLATSWPVPVHRSDIKPHCPRNGEHGARSDRRTAPDHTWCTRARAVLGVGPALLVTAVVSPGAATAVRVTVTPFPA